MYIIIDDIIYGIRLLIYTIFIEYLNSVSYAIVKIYIPCSLAISQANISTYIIYIPKSHNHPCPMYLPIWRLIDRVDLSIFYETVQRLVNSRPFKLPALAKAPRGSLISCNSEGEKKKKGKTAVHSRNGLYRYCARFERHAPRSFPEIGILALVLSPARVACKAPCCTLSFDGALLFSPLHSCALCSFFAGGDAVGENIDWLNFGNDTEVFKTWVCDSFFSCVIKKIEKKIWKKYC